MKRARLQKQPQRGGALLTEAVKIFCRVRPHPDPLGSQNDAACIRIDPPNNIILLPPASVNRNGASKQLQYTFRQVFDESASQKEVFEKVALPQIRNFLEGQNSLILTYGVTGSGKTYTMTGTPRNGGLMPRCFDAIFDSIAEYQAKRHVFKPDKFNGFFIQPDGGVDAEADLQARITMAKVKLEKKNSDPDLAQRVRDEVYSLPVDTANCFGVFITYIEIYNNNVYDLLEDIFDDNTRIRPLQTKIVREDSNHNMFVNGVNEIEVSSTDEAFETYFYGQKRRRIAQTALNAESSRSHSVFTIRLVQALANDQGNIVDPERRPIVSQLSLVDLAGSERTNRTKNTGLRLKEAGNINNSLLTLRTCLEILRENQNGANKMVPYRDSRLTHLFRNFFDGDGHVSMIICVSPLIDECEETMQVLKFAEMSQEISTTVQTPLKPGCSNGRRKVYDAYEIAAKEFDELNKGAQGDFKVPRPSLRFDMIPDMNFFEISDQSMLPEIRQILQNGLDQFKAIREKIDFQTIRSSIVKLERDAYVAMNQSRALESQYEVEKEKVNNLEEKLHTSEKDHLRMKRKLDETECVVKRLKSELSSKDMIIKVKNQEQERSKEEFANKMVQAQERLNRQLDRKMKTQRAVFEHEMKNQEGRIKMARQVLCNDLPSYATPARSRVPPSKSVESIPSSIKGVSGTGVKSTFMYGTPSISAVTNAPNPQLSGIGNTPRPTSRKGVPVVNRRYRRSRSVENDVWLEHRPAHEVPTNTLMQPVMTKRKSITKLTDSKDVTEKTNKYCLLTQNQDSDGDLETRLYKGDVIPTAGGGAQVTFNDVEVLKQISPNVSPSRKTPGQIRKDLEAACAQSTESYWQQHRNRAKKPQD